MKSSITAILLLLAASQATNAMPVFHTTQGSFDSATVSLSFSTEDFTSASPGDLSFGTTHSFNGFTASAAQNTTNSNNMGLAIFPSPHLGSQHAPFTSSQYLGWAEDTPFKNGSGNFGPTVTLSFSSPITAISFDFLDSDGTDEYHLFVDGQNSGASFPSFSSGTDSAFFFGITDLAGISSIAFSADSTSPGGFVEEFGIDNVNIAANSAVPVPAAVWLMGSALLGLAGFKRKKS